jgi:hypothetical protein
MSRWITTTKDPKWAELFTSFTKSAFRLEGQQTYNSPGEKAEFDRFLAGEPLRLELSWMRPKITAQIAAGHTWTTVRVVVEPQTDYTRFEMAVYPEFVAMGEDIRIISVKQGDWPESVPRHDYWLFDDRDVWRMHYRDDHSFAGAELLEDDASIQEHLLWRDAAIAQSVPLAEHLAS